MTSPVGRATPAVVSRRSARDSRRPRAALPKAPTGIHGLDEITGGGLPRGRPTLVSGSAGCGKTLLAMEFLVRGARDFGEPGVFMSFEENAAELTTNFGPLGYDLTGLVARRQLALEFVYIERSEIEETGDYDLEGLFLRLGAAIDGIGARRVVLDTIEALFSGLTNTAILRAELRRLFRWLKARGVTAIITGEQGESGLTRYGLEEYVADCVIVLDHRVDGQMATRRMRIVKYRGSLHGTSEYPFLIDDGGISVLPVTSIGLRHAASSERVSSGVPGLDAMMGGKGYYRGSTVLLSGTAGSGKTSLAAHFARAATARGERCLWLAYEESQSQIIRNMRSIGLDLEPAVRRGLLRFEAHRPTLCGLEMHLVSVYRAVTGFEPRTVIVDPITAFGDLGSAADVNGMLTRLIDFLKGRQVTAFFTSLTSGGAFLEATDVGVSSLVDTWLLLRDLESGAERNRVLHLLKSRGMAHSNQVREFHLTDRGAELLDVYTGPSGQLLTGSLRVTVEARERAEEMARGQEADRRRRELEHRRQALEAQIAALRAQFQVERAEAHRGLREVDAASQELARGRDRMARLRQGNGAARQGNGQHRAGRVP